MRIVSGRFRGARLSVPTALGLRPTTDQVREAIFSALGTAIVGKRVLDIFAGTGALGFEALSRGALSAVFVDTNRKVTEALRMTVREFHLETEVRILTMSAERAVRILAQLSDCFGVIFMDPPYHTNWIDRMFRDPTFAELLEPEGIVVTERDVHDGPLSPPATFTSWFLRKYGGTLVEMFRLDASGSVPGDFDGRHSHV